MGTQIPPVMNEPKEPITTPSALLIAAKKLIEDRKCWRKFLYRDRSSEPNAFCAIGALEEAGERYRVHQSVSDMARSYLDSASPVLPVTDYNDHLANHQNILDLYDGAIAMAYTYEHRRY